MQDKDRAKYFIEGKGNEKYTFLDIETMIKNGEIKADSRLYNSEPDGGIISSPKVWKNAIEFHEFKSVFNKLPPPQE